MNLSAKHQGGRCRRDSLHRKDSPDGRMADEQDRSADRHAEQAENGGCGQGHRPDPSHRFSVVVCGGRALRDGLPCGGFVALAGRPDRAVGMIRVVVLRLIYD